MLASRRSRPRRPSRRTQGSSNRVAARLTSTSKEQTCIASRRLLWNTRVAARTWRRPVLTKNPEMRQRWATRKMDRPNWNGQALVTRKRRQQISQTQLTSTITTRRSWPPISSSRILKRRQLRGISRGHRCLRLGDRIRKRSFNCLIFEISRKRSQNPSASPRNFKKNKTVILK